MSQRIEFGRFVIEVVPVDRLDLLEKNARFMTSATFDRLVQNIRQDGQISQLPFCVERESGRLLVLSGNHRVKAARKAGIEFIPIIRPTQALTPQQELAIQLSHNAIAGEDDPVILKELWDSLADVDLKMYSGLDDKSLGTLMKQEMPALADVRLDFRTVTLLFLPNEVDQVKAAFAGAREMAHGNAMLLARVSEYERLLDALAETNAAHNIANVATGLLVILDIFAKHRDELSSGWTDGESETPIHKNWVPLSSIFGTDKIPAEAAMVIKRAVDGMVARDDVANTARWQALEFWAADTLGGVES